MLITEREFEMSTSQELLGEALLEQMLVAMALDGELETPFAYERAVAKVKETLWLFDHRNELPPSTDEEVKKAECFAERFSSQSIWRQE